MENFGRGITNRFWTTRAVRVVYLCRSSFRGISTGYVNFIARLASILEIWLVDYHYLHSTEYSDIVDTHNFIIYGTSPRLIINQLTIQPPSFDPLQYTYSAVVDITRNRTDFSFVTMDAIDDNFIDKNYPTRSNT